MRRRELADWRLDLMPCRPREWARIPDPPPPGGLGPEDRETIRSLLSWVDDSVVVRGPITYQKANRLRTEIYLTASCLELDKEALATRFGKKPSFVARALKEGPPLAAAAYIRAQAAGAVDFEGKITPRPDPPKPPAPPRKRIYIRHKPLSKQPSE